MSEVLWQSSNMDASKQKRKRKLSQEATTFKDRLKSAIRKKRVTESQVARKIGVKRSTISDWTAGAIPQDSGAALRLSRYLDIDFQFLMTGEHSRGSTGAKNEKASLALIDSELGEYLEMDNQDADFTGLFVISARRVRIKRRKP